MLEKEAHRIEQCILRYGSRYTTILLFIQDGHVSCIQALEVYLLNSVAKGPMLKVTASSSAILKTASNKTAAEIIAEDGASSFKTDIPGFVVCHSCQDAIEYVNHILDLAQNMSSSVTPSYVASQQRCIIDTSSQPIRKQDPWSIWLTMAISIQQDSILTPYDGAQLRTQLCNIQNMSLATSLQYRNDCCLNDSVARSIEAFFETDQPI
ncbi:hypothetical protein BCR41DRAFT_393349 [Lobosporangium transversale]|uniref:Uncharacterized protein n=1 Tax=Lobosporangium transversale TaxID=64571 RepID=A0A1Y2GY96_9FUNG|nr:hypothetical protein BCR41DRAFT_393349 [Lobosporangium transversale]ORZ26741.1 hypothetical protein BCR41DRAFT_393349 [Lobosporangium transversale]|eukprot:XP_021884504.1 hypothetical protein BCR41DRAFT_393349 [Lobosporangium transversale]